MKKKNLIISFLLMILFLVFTALVKNVDLDTIGPEGSIVGFSKINNYFHELIGFNNTCYIISDIFGYLVLLLVPVFGVKGIIQLIRRKSLLKVDPDILVMGLFYIIVLGFYVIFEKIIINYRPVLMDGMLEASYPSSHTVLSLCVCGSALIYNKYNKIFKNFNIIAIVLMVLTVVFRFISGVHWFTDIIGGLLLSTALVYLYYTIIDLIHCKNID